MKNVIKFNKAELLKVCPDFKAFQEMCKTQYKKHFKTNQSIADSWFALTGEKISIKKQLKK